MVWCIDSQSAPPLHVLGKTTDPGKRMGISVIDALQRGSCNLEMVLLPNGPSLYKVSLLPKCSAKRVVFRGSPHRTTQHYDIGGVSAALVKQRHAPVVYACAWLPLGWLGTE